MRELWTRIESSLSRGAPEVLRSLRKGATDAAIRKVEAAIGVRFPADLAASFRIHDGQRAEAPDMTDGFALLPLARVLAEWRTWQRLDQSGEFRSRRPATAGHHRRVWWSPRWIPITSNGAGDSHCIDLAPGPNGKRGQVILMQHDSPKRPLIAGNMRAWLSDWATDLEASVERESAPKRRAAATEKASTVSLEQLTQIVGRSVRDAKVRALLESQPLRAEKLEFGERALTSASGGYDITHDGNGRITAIHVFTVGDEEHEPFMGALCPGVSAKSGRADVRKRLKKPTRSSENADNASFGGYDRYDGPRVCTHIRYRSDGPGIDLITLMSADTAP
jgi:cell wall assembly regulator SMI1